MLKHLVVIAALVSKLGLLALGSSEMVTTSYGPEPECVPGDPCGS